MKTSFWAGRGTDSAPGTGFRNVPVRFVSRTGTFRKTHKTLANIGLARAVRLEQAFSSGAGEGRGGTRAEAMSTG